MADPGVIRACVELCDYLNGKVAVALVRVHSQRLLQHNARGRMVAGEALKVLHYDEPDEAMTLLKKAEILAANTSLAHGESHVRVCCQTLPTLECLLLQVLAAPRKLGYTFYT